jgi:hypothetical protein
MLLKVQMVSQQRSQNTDCLVKNAQSQYSKIFSNTISGNPRMSAPDRNPKTSIPNPQNYKNATETQFPCATERFLCRPQHRACGAALHTTVRNAMLGAAGLCRQGDARRQPLGAFELPEFMGRLVQTRYDEHSLIYFVIK